MYSCLSTLFLLLRPPLLSGNHQVNHNSGKGEDPYNAEGDVLKARILSAGEQHKPAFKHQESVDLEVKQEIDIISVPLFTIHFMQCLLTRVGRKYCKSFLCQKWLVKATFAETHQLEAGQDAG